MTGESGLLRSSDVGRVNRARVMRLLHVTGPLTRADLAVRLDVSRATVGTVVQPLLDEGILIEQPARSAGGAGGKPSRPLWFGSGHRVGAVYLSADECVVASLSMTGQIAAVGRCGLASDEPEAILASVLEASGALEVGPSPIGIGVAFAGMVDSTTGSQIANYRRPAVGRVRVGQALGAAFGVPVFVEHHPRVQAFGDAWFGLGRSLDSFGSIVTGEVLGLGVVQNGDVHAGLRGSGGEAGHMVVNMAGALCNCGRRGCWETVATLGWLRQQAAMLGLSDPGAVTAARLVASTDSTEHDLAHRYARAIALGLANIEQILGLGTYILHGDAVGGGEQLRGWVERALVENSPRREPTPHVLFAASPDDMVLLGGAALVLANLYPHTPAHSAKTSARKPGAQAVPRATSTPSPQR